MDLHGMVNININHASLPNIPTVLHTSSSIDDILDINNSDYNEGNMNKIANKQQQKFISINSKNTNDYT
jgi:hypothetical protein